MAVLIHHVDVDAMAGALGVPAQRIQEAFERRHYSDEFVDDIMQGGHDRWLITLLGASAKQQVCDAVLRRIAEWYPNPC